MSICKIVEKVIQKYGLPWAFRVMGEHRLEATNIVPYRSCAMRPGLSLLVAGLVSDFATELIESELTTMICSPLPGFCEMDRFDINVNLIRPWTNPACYARDRFSGSWAHVSWYRTRSSFPPL